MRRASAFRCGSVATESDYEDDLVLCGSTANGFPRGNLRAKMKGSAHDAAIERAPFVAVASAPETPAGGLVGCGLGRAARTLALTLRARQDQFRLWC
jgi:hypothetical protein